VGFAVSTRFYDDLPVKSRAGSIIPPIKLSPQFPIKLMCRMPRLWLFELF